MKKVNRVLFISDAGDKRGAQKSLMELMKTLKNQHGVSPVLLTKKYNGLNKTCDELGIENYHYWYPYVMASSPYNIKMINFVKHVLGFMSYFAGAVWVRGIEKTGLDFDSIDVIHTNTNRVDLGLFLHKRYGIPHVMHLREFGAEDFGSVLYRPKMFQAFNKNTNYFIAISNCVKKGWVDKGLCADQIEVIYNGLDTSRYAEKENVSHPELRIALAGAINKFKGQIQLIEALYLLSDDVREHVKVTFLGTGKFDYVKEMKKKADQWGVSEQIEFAGYSDHLEEVLREYDLGIITSKAEGFGRVTVEYMLSGLCVIASDTGANPEILRDGQTGYIYHYGSASDLAKKITWVYEHPEERKKMALAGHDYALNAFTTEINAGNIFMLYEKII